MCWKECDAMSQRREFAVLGSVEGANVAALCRRFGISRKTGYKWLSRFREAGEVGLGDRSRRPHRFRVRTRPEMERHVLAVRRKHPSWGGRKISACLKRAEVTEVPAPSTITAILQRHGQIASEESAKRKPLVRFEREEANELWQMDFKGEFRMTNGRWCYPLTVLDDHSRYSLVLAACENQQRETVQRHLVEAFRRYGVPRSMLMDNGPPWGTPCRCGGPSVLSVWLMDLDVAVIHGRPYHPQTQGKEERFHRTLKLEVLQGRTFDNPQQVQLRFALWREVYNCERPHEALGMSVPASRYRTSPREYREPLASFEYDQTFAVRHVTAEGRVVFKDHVYHVGKAFARRRVGLRPIENDGQWAIYYRTFRVATIDERTGQRRRR
jgi:transposase InsO family protein